MTPWRLDLEIYGASICDYLNGATTEFGSSAQVARPG